MYAYLKKVLCTIVKIFIGECRTFINIENRN